MNKVNIKKLIGLLSITTIVIIGGLFTQFLIEQKKVDKVKNCILETDILLERTSSRYSSDINITKNLYKADYVIRNGKQIKIYDICNK